MATKLFVGGLSWDTTEDSLRNLFSQIGMVASCTIVTDKFTGKSRGFGFVEMSNPEDSQKAIAELNGKQLDGRAIAVNEARPMQPRENRGFGGGGHSGGGGGFSRDNHSRGGFDRRGGNGGGDRGGRKW
jgi:RNA recognition motif-containing protein